MRSISSMEETTPPLTPKTPSASAARRLARGRSLSNSISSLSSYSYSSSSSSSNSYYCTTFSSPSPCPSPYLRSWSAVPFSWEQRPGIPKPLPSPSPSPSAPAAPDACSITRPLLPLPPPARQPYPRRARTVSSRFAGPSPNPFAEALALCSRGLPNDEDDDGKENAAEEDLWRGRRLHGGARAAIADRFRLFRRYGSCKASCAVAEATVRLPRALSFGSLDGRSDSTDPVRD